MPANSQDHRQPPASCDAVDEASLVTRRQFLVGASATAVWLSIPGWTKGAADVSVQAHIAQYPRRRVGSLSALQTGEPVAFNYPWEDPRAANNLIKLGRRAGGGVGPAGDVVAFNTFCTHQGGPLAAVFKANPGVAGPCPLHWTTFDLTRHGMVVGGHATQGLPQIILETQGGQIYATGVLGLVFGYQDNLADPGAAS